MSVIDQISEQWFRWIVAASWQLALLVCVVALVARAARPASPRLRHALWLLVLAKVFLPPSLTAPWSIGHWAVTPLLENPRVSELITSKPPAVVGSGEAQDTTPGGRQDNEPLADPGFLKPATVLLIVWSAGCLFLWSLVGWRYARLTRAVRSASRIDEGPVRVTLEKLAISLNLRRVPELFCTTIVTSPFLFGVARPRIVLPKESLAQLGPAELQAVLAHELVHWKNHDTWIGWLQVLAQGLFWFHPFLWWANSQLRHERECVCDEAVLRLGLMSSQGYGESIVRVLTIARGRSLVAGSLMGVFERGAKLQNRLEEIMNFDPMKRRFGWFSRVALVAFAILFVPMAPGYVDFGRADAKADDSVAVDVKAATATAANTPYPQIVKTMPERGATGVDPELQEIAVTFDRDMQKGMSWTGGPPLFPPTDETRKTRWTDARTCVLPVQLKKASYYRLGINSKSYQNFKSSDGVPAPSSSIYFVTKGAGAAIEARVRTPKIVSLKPKNGATDVEPKTKVLRVTFDVPMGDGMSWTGDGPSFPKLPDGKPAAWSKDGLTCTLPGELEPDHAYQLGLNSLSHGNFESKWGVPLPPVVYTFRTASTKP